jgi:TolB protein
MRILLLVSIGLLTMVISNGQEVISRLEIVNAKSGERRVVKEFDGRVEAPNWTPDGEHLVYNSGGLIYTIPVTGGEPALINTGGVKGCNNDHVISADGNTLAISARGPSSHSQIYVLPITGGEPRLVTPLGPSYLHGISPDGKYLAYCANRNGNYDVYVIPTEGGEEIRLTTTEGLDDGPEYSPDGKYIWFNSVRSGLMQAWRMKVDGSEQTQMTFEDSNNWFPHISPDGKKVAYITYQKGDVKPGSHPPNKNVELRLMSANGGASKTLVQLFGGQGTFNVHSWSPDSKEFAFVSYELTGTLKESSDVGNPKLKGSTAFDPTDQSYTLTGAGENVWAEKDGFHFAWLKVTGDFSMSTNFKFEGEGVNAHRKVGIMVRETLDGDSPYADVTVHGDGLTSLQYRLEKGAVTNEIKADITGSDHIVLERSGNKIAIKTAIGKEPSGYAAETEMVLPATCYVGIFICSHEADVVEKAYFQNLKLTQ